MNPREKTMAAAILGLAGLFVVGFGVRALFLKPLHELDSRIAGVRDKLSKISVVPMAEEKEIDNLGISAIES